MKDKKTKILYCVYWVIILTIIICYLFNPFSYIKDSDFINKVNNEAISANIYIITVITEESGSTSYSTGYSGAIFKKEEGKYYALTALHAIPLEQEMGHMELMILGYDQPTFVEANVQNIGLKEYYSRYPRAKLEYYDEIYDLAVISFFSESEYTALPIATEPPKRKEIVATMGNPLEYNRNSITTGKIMRKYPVFFGDKAARNQLYAIYHSARISTGNSGGALLNKNLEIVGINLGGSENIIHRFVQGMAMPCDKLLDFLNDMEE